MRILEIWNPQVYYSFKKSPENKNNKFRKSIKNIEIILDDANNLGKYNSIKNEVDAI